MRVLVGGAAVGRPARVADAHRSSHGPLAQHAFEHLDATGRAPHLEAGGSEHGHPGRIVPAILEPLQPLHDDTHRILVPEVADDPAHGSVLLLGGTASAAARHPAFLHHLRAPLDGERTRRHVLGDDGACSHEGVVADGERRHHAAVTPHEGAVSHLRLVLVGAVVVHEDHAGADVDAVTHRDVADVGEVARLASPPDARLLHLDEVAHARLGPDVGSRAQMTEGTELRFALHHRVGDHAVWLEVHAVTHPRPLQVTARLHRALRADVRGTLQDDAGVEHGVAPDLHRVVDVGGVGIQHGDALRHVALERPAPECLCHLRELAAVVDAETFVWVRCSHRLGDGAILG